MCKRKVTEKAKFHGPLDKEPYIWLFWKIDSELHFKDQLICYSLNTQYDVKMARSELTIGTTQMTLRSDLYSLK